MFTNHHDAKAWVSVLSGALGRSLDWDGRGNCILEFEEGIDVSVAPMPESDFLSASAPITPAGEPVAAEALRKALALNYGELPLGFTAALEPETGQLALLATLHIDDASPEYVLEVLDGFLALVPRLRAHVGHQVHDRPLAGVSMTDRA